MKYCEVDFGIIADGGEMQNFPGVLTTDYNPNTFKVAVENVYRGENSTVKHVAIHIHEVRPITEEQFNGRSKSTIGGGLNRASG